MSKDWRTAYFNKKSCDGVLLNDGKGNVTIKGKIKGNKDSRIIYWAANPPNFRSSFSGSGLPFVNTDQAFDRSPNVGSVNTVNGEFEFKIFYPNAYYAGLGSLYIPPHVHIKVCDGQNKNEYHSIKISDGIPFRTLTYPAPPSKNPRVSPMFYYNENLPIRKQEDILRDSAYPSHGTKNNIVVEDKVPDNFWGLRPAR